MPDGWPPRPTCHAVRVCCATNKHRASASLSNRPASTVDQENTIVSHQEEPKRILCFQCSSQTSMHPSIHSAWERFKFDWHKADYAWNTTIHHDASSAAHFVARPVFENGETTHAHTHTLASPMDPKQSVITGRPYYSSGVAIGGLNSEKVEQRTCASVGHVSW